MNQMLLGAIAMACFTVSLLFARSWKTTRDRFFLFFAVSFFIEGCNRLMLGLFHYSSEEEPFFYLLRLLSFIIILWAIFDKNLRKKERPASD